MWYEEIKNNPNLFKTNIITTHDTKEAALEKEEYLQKHFSVHVNELYVNQSITGRYFTSQKGKKLTEEHKRKIGVSNSKALKGKKFTEERRQKLKGKIPWNKGMKGYNSGKNHHRFGKNVNDEIKNKISNTLKNNSCRSKTYKIIHPNGKIETIKGLKKYCEFMDWPYKYVLRKMKQRVDFRGYHINEQNK